MYLGSEQDIFCLFLRCYLSIKLLAQSHYNIVHLDKTDAPYFGNQNVAFLIMVLILVVDYAPGS